jgi:hypothetical protein
MAHDAFDAGPDGTGREARWIRALAAKLRIGTSLPTEASQPARALHRAARFLKRAHANRSVEWRPGSIDR